MAKTQRAVNHRVAFRCQTISKAQFEKSSAFPHKKQVTSETKTQSGLQWTKSSDSSLPAVAA
jgi:hypothetical protein